MIYIRDLIRKKRENLELSEAEISFFIYSYNRDEITSDQAGVLLDLMYTKGLTIDEMVYLSKAMAKTGVLNDIYKLSSKIVDIHPIGGMDDKIVILLLAILKTLGYPAIKFIGREIGIQDKLPKVKVQDFDLNDIEKNINDQLLLINEPQDMAPVENKLYKLRNNIACDDDISLIAISLMSQKLAIGAKNIIFDISYGEKAYVKTFREAKRLSKYLIKIGNSLNRNVKCFITALNEPVGKSFGNIIELKEIIDASKGEMNSDVKELIFKMGSNIINLIDSKVSIVEAKSKIQKIIEDGSLNNTLTNLVPQYSDYEIGDENTIPVMSNYTGYIENIDMSDIRTTGIYLNAIRHRKNEKISLNAGIEFSKKVGDSVKKGELIGYIYTEDKTKVQKAVQNLKDAYRISKSKIKKKSRIEEIM